MQCQLIAKTALAFPLARVGWVALAVLRDGPIAATATSTSLASTTAVATATAVTAVTAAALSQVLAASAEAVIAMNLNLAVHPVDHSVRRLELLQALRLQLLSAIGALWEEGAKKGEGRRVSLLE